MNDYTIDHAVSAIHQLVGPLELEKIMQLEALVKNVIEKSRRVCLDHTSRAREEERFWIYRAIRVGRINGLRPVVILGRLEAICNPNDEDEIEKEIRHDACEGPTPEEEAAFGCSLPDGV